MRSPIVISAQQIEEMRSELRLLGLEPDQGLLQSRIQQDVDEEILYQEAKRLALDVSDPSVRLRLVQKMRAVSDLPNRSEEVLVYEARQLGLDEDAVIRRLLAEKMRIELRRANGPEAVSDSALAEILDSKRYAQPAALTFMHIFAEGESGPQLTKRVKRLKFEIAHREPFATSLDGVGDVFLLGHLLRSYSHARLLARFGESFANAVFALQPGGWSAPIASPYGMPETGQLRLDRNLIVISPNIGGAEKGACFSYPPHATTHRMTMSMIWPLRPRSDRLSPMKMWRCIFSRYLAARMDAWSRRRA